MIAKAVQSAPFLILVLSLILGCGSEASGEEPEQQAGLSPGIIMVDDFQMTWIVIDSEIEITATAPTTGWIAVGFEPSAAMKDADIIMGYVSGGEVFLRDDWGDNYTSHKPDIDLGGTDDVTAVSGSEENGTTTITFSIPLSSADQYDKALEAGNTYKVLLAYGPDDADDFDGYHDWAETVEIEL